MRLAIGCDHRGLELKQAVKGMVAQAGHACQDFGCCSPEPVDYPDIARQVAEAVTGGNFERGILVCDSGIGMSIAANKVRGARAALCGDAFMARRARQHNDANILCLGTHQPLEAVREMIDAFLTTEFEGGRHARRLDKIRAMEGEG
ncbi:MAG: ribose 5-phosphate isomerase B [Chloroflexi bacterium]|nr:ribose 5-phosphate isomerase B [Chloroflexota bacterium]